MLCLFTVARLSGASRGSVEHSEGKDGESIVAILRFLCGCTHPCRLRTVPFWPWWQALSCVRTTCSVFMRPSKPSCHVTTSPNRIPCLKDVVGRGMRLRAQNSPVGRGPISMKLGLHEWLSYMRASGSWAYGVLVRFFLCRVYIDSSHHDTLGYEWQLVHRSHLVVCLVNSWLIQGVWYGYGYYYIIIMIIVFTYLWRWQGSIFCLFMHVLVCRCKHSTWLN
jgi:hypothetical protein